MNKWLSTKHLWGKGLWPTAVCLFCLLLLSGPAAAEAGPGPTVDWRGNLTCPAEQQRYAGILYCTGRYTGTDGNDHDAHVLVMDLTEPGLGFEYVLPRGASDGHEGIQECRDPNVPAEGGPAGGCFVPGNEYQYPRLTLSEAVARACENARASWPLVAVVNGDYMAPNGTHGPEGLLVVREKRLDGAVRCDDDYNAALRPWLGLGQDVDPVTGRLPAQIARLESDGAFLPLWLYTAIGGGPWLVSEGQADDQAARCQSDYRLEQIDPVTNCTGRKKTTPAGPLGEGYEGGACRLAPHTAAGLSQDRRWLFLAVSTGNDRPDALAEFLRGKLGAWNVIKFDGGGSSHLWYAGEQEISIDPTGEERALSSHLAVYARPGAGISLPLEATPVQRVYYQVLAPGEDADLTLEVANTGPYSWLPEDGVELRAEPFFLLSPVVHSLPLSGPVRPGEIATFSWKVGSGGLASNRLQMFQKGQAFGPDLAVIVITLPEGLEDRRQELETAIQELIDEWQARGEQELDGLVKELEERAGEILRDLLHRALTGLLRALEEAVQGSCASLWIGLAPVALAAVLARGRPRP